MADESLGQRKRNAIVAGTLLAITLIASLASILPFVGVTSVGQLGIAVGRIGTRSVMSARHRLIGSSQPTLLDAR